MTTVVRQWFSGVFLILLMTTLMSCGGSKGSFSSFTSADSGGTGQTQSFSNVGLGAIQTLSISSTSTLDFGTSNNSDYLLILNTPEESSNSLTVGLSQTDVSGLTTAALTLPNPENTEEAYQDDAAGKFHQYLREMETVMAQSDDFRPVKKNQSAALQTDLSVGSVQPFYVLSTLTSINKCETVSGVLKYASKNLYVYVDKRDTDLISDTNIKLMASDFENIALPRERILFGGESDVNGDGHISILLTEVINKQAGSFGLITGYFFPGDLSEANSSNPCSNAQEIFYGLMADPNGNFGTPISEEFIVKSILPGVFAHEYQHMASFNQHVLVHNGSSEASSINEYLSHFAEDITGFGNENPARMRIGLSQISKTALLPSSSPNLAERGLGYLFMRYLYEQNPNGDLFIQNLYSSDRIGVENVVTAYNKAADTKEDPNFNEYSEFVNRWTTALALSNTGLTSSSLYNYRERTINSQTGNYMGPLIRGEALDGRGTVQSGPVMTTVSSFPVSATVAGTGTQFFRLVSPSGSIQVSTGSSNITGTLVKLEPQ